MVLYDTPPKCPGCESGNCKHFLNEGGLAIWRCRDCRLAFIWPLPSSGELETKFRDSYINNENRVFTRFEQHRREALDYVACIVKSSCAGGRLLDVGTAGGAFLLRFQNDPAWEVQGVEPSRVAAEYGRRQYGLSLYQGFLRDASFPDGCFDAVCMLDAFYFLANPREELQEIRRVLKPGGRLFVEVPNLEYRLLKDCGPLGYLLNRRWVNLYQGAHITFYNQKSLIRLLTNAGFAVRAIYPVPGMKLDRQSHDILIWLYQKLALLLYYLSLSKINLLPKFLITSQNDD